MSLYKRESGIWWVSIATPSGKRIRCSTETTIKKKAEEFHDKLKAEQWRVNKLEEEPKYIFEDALILYVKDAENVKDKATRKRHATYWRTCFAGKELNTLTTKVIINKVPTHNASTGKPLSNTTQNKYLKSLGRILNLAYQSGYIDKIPYLPKKKEPPVRVRWLTRKQAQTLIANISTEWMKNICLFALLTGARRTEILTMTWDKIDFNNRIALVTNDVAKSGKARSLLLNEEAINVLQNQKGKHHKFIFVSSTGKPLLDINRKTFNLATKRCGIKDFHFHDLRHTWASWHAQAGTPLFTLKELGGWETLEMVKKYAHLNADHLLSHAESVSIYSSR